LSRKLLKENTTLKGQIITDKNTSAFTKIIKKYLKNQVLKETYRGIKGAKKKFSLQYKVLLHKLHI